MALDSGVDVLHGTAEFIASLLERMPLTVVGDHLALRAERLIRRRLARMSLRLGDLAQLAGVSSLYDTSFIETAAEFGRSYRLCYSSGQ